MNHFYLLAVAVFALTAASTLNAADESKDPRCFELRVYYAAEGKLDALNARFRDHTCKLFEKHGMTNVGYWMPLDNPEHKLYYILAYPTREAREASWKAFMADPDWKAAAAASEKDGKLVAKVESKFLHATDFSPAVKPDMAKEPRVFELRTYVATPGNLKHLLARFRDHTMQFFTKHGMTNVGYWTLDSDQPVADVTLIYLLAHPSKEARESSFNAFRDNPDWKAVRTASEKTAGGSLTIKDGVKFVLMAPTDYSPLK